VPNTLDAAAGVYSYAFWPNSKRKRKKEREKGKGKKERGILKNGPTLSTFFVLKTFCKILKLARDSYSCFAENLTRVIGKSPV
jgi:hypothetical protein